jgi:hypothetical protein
MDTAPTASEIYQQGLDAGSKYMVEGLRDGVWNFPDKSPYPSNSQMEQKWWGGFYDGSSDVESANE